MVIIDFNREFYILDIYFKGILGTRVFLDNREDIYEY